MHKPVFLIGSTVEHLQTVVTIKEHAILEDFVYADLHTMEINVKKHLINIQVYQLK